MKLIIMTKATFFVEENQILTTLFEEGLENLHLYKPGSEPVYSERLLTLLDEDYHRYITVHDHFYLKEEFGLRGIHLNDAQSELPQGYRGNFSRTCHALDELREAKRKASYVFLQNIFDSQSNPADRQSFTADELHFPWCYDTFRIVEDGPLRVSVQMDFAPVVHEAVSAKPITEHRLVTLDRGSNFCRLTV